MAIQRRHLKEAGSVRTTDGTTTTVVSMTIPTDYAGFIEGVIAGRDASGGATATCVHRIVAEVQNVSGTVTLTNNPFESETPGAVGNTTTLDVSGTAVRLRIDNVAGTATIDWYGELEAWLVAAS